MNGKAGSAVAHVHAPAKINLFLHITGRRDDGYHELDSLFLPLALGDDLKITIGASVDRKHNAVSCKVPAHRELDGADNLAARAASLYLRRAGLVGIDVSVLIHKRIWIAAGLGGGSSDAAAVLTALDQHFGALGRDALQEVALQLGADVPFFLLGVPARATGVGEILEPLKPSALPRLELVLVNPNVPLATSQVFGALDREKISSKPPPPQLELSSLDAVAALVSNDLCRTAVSLCPQIAEIMELFNEALVVGMTGSGPTVFGVYLSRDEAQQVVRRIQQSGQQTGIRAIATHSRTG